MSLSHAEPRTEREVFEVLDGGEWLLSENLCFGSMCSNCFNLYSINKSSSCCIPNTISS